MLDGVTPQQFDEWLAYRELEPDPLERLIGVVKLGFATLVAAWGMKIEPSDLDPWGSEPQEASPEQSAAIVRGKLGPPNGNRNR
jgi:hypothetical protein